MKTFEEQWTAWIDGELKGKELADFELNLADLDAAEAERKQLLQLGSLLKEHLVAQPMQNADFFSHQLRQRLAAEEGTEPAELEEPAQSPAWWSFGRLAWAGATSLAILAMCTFFLVRPQPPGDQSRYLTDVLNARVDKAVHPDATVTIFQAKDDKAVVLWLDGLESLPSEYATK